MKPRMYKGILVPKEPPPTSIYVQYQTTSTDFLNRKINTGPRLLRRIFLLWYSWGISTHTVFAQAEGGSAAERGAPSERGATKGAGRMSSCSPGSHSLLPHMREGHRVALYLCPPGPPAVPCKGPHRYHSRAAHVGSCWGGTAQPWVSTTPPHECLKDLKGKGALVSCCHVTVSKHRTFFQDNE